MTAEYILNWMNSAYPNKLPRDNVSPFELGVLIGQQQLIEQLKIKLKIEENKDVIIK